MDDEEGDQPECENKMDGAGSLPPAEQRREEMKARIKPRRHRHAGQDHHRYQNEDDGEIGELLQHVVVPGLVPLRKAKPDVLPDLVRNSAPATTPRPQVAAT